MPRALGYLRRAPYRNALLLSNLSQLRDRCDVLLAERGKQLICLASTYHDLPVPNLIFAADSHAAAATLVEALVERNPALGGAPVMALLPEDRFRQMCRFATLVAHNIEYQMVVEPETLRIPAHPQAQRLTADDLPALNQLASEAGLEVWHAGALALGPAFGCFAEGQLVAMAATHFATPDVIEIGHVATHPAFRRRGYAQACTAALAQAALALAPRIFLMVLDDNAPALAAYRAIGFTTNERFYLAQFAVGGR